MTTTLNAHVLTQFYNGAGPFTADLFVDSITGDPTLFSSVNGTTSQGQVIAINFAPQIQFTINVTITYTTTSTDTFPTVLLDPSVISSLDGSGTASVVNKTFTSGVSVNFSLGSQLVVYLNTPTNIPGASITIVSSSIVITSQGISPPGGPSLVPIIIQALQALLDRASGRDRRRFRKLIQCFFCRKDSCKSKSRC